VKAFSPDRIRNVALVGPPGSGKTSLAEAMLFRAGAVTRVGRVEDGSTVCDHDPEEKESGHSIGAALAVFEWHDHKVNLLDTPGAFDFAGEAIGALAAADLAVFVVDASSGLDHTTVDLWREAAARSLPRLIFVNKLDREYTSFEKVLAELQNTFGAGVAPLEIPIGEAEGFHGIADLLTDKAWIYDSGHAELGEIPDEMEEREAAIHAELIENIVVADDALLESYLDGEVPSFDELEQVMGRGVAAGTVFPVVCGSATIPIAVDRLCNYIVEVGPSPLDRPPVEVTVAGLESTVEPDPATDVLLQVFKTAVDPYLGHVSYFRVLTGTVRRDLHLINGRTGDDERFRSVMSLRGGESVDVDQLPAGDIGAVAKLSGTLTGDTLSGAGRAVAPPIGFPTPVLSVAVAASTRNDEDKLANALHRIVEEDPVLTVHRDDETHQTLMSGLGESHLRSVISKLDRKFGVKVDTDDVRVPFRETITRSASAEGKYKKQSGGHGQFGVASIRLEPTLPGSGFEFVDEVKGGVIPRQHIPAVEAGIREAMAHGGTAGYPVVDVRATVFDGRHHAVDSSEMSFKMAGRLAFQEALALATPVVLEPISSIEVTVPAECLGDVMGDLSSRRATVQGSIPSDWGEQVISAAVPASEILRYAIDLRSITGGRGRFTTEHDHYSRVPPGVKVPEPPER
jgi:elongation factor G|tara:strand:+ start:2431 stop:4482 length:2052 start_codon:yes stop_codon:yes gene_type:complete